MPGKIVRRVQVGIDERGNGIQPMELEDEARERPMSEGEDAPTQFRGGPDKFHVSKRVVERCRPIENCPTCASITKRDVVSGRTSINQTIDARGG